MYRRRRAARSLCEALSRSTRGSPQANDEAQFFQNGDHPAHYRSLPGTRPAGEDEDTMAQGRGDSLSLSFRQGQAAGRFPIRR